VGVANPQSWRREGRRGSGMVPFERALVSSYKPSVHSNFSSIFTRFRDIAAFLLQHSTFPTPSLVSSKFSHVSLGVGGCPFGYEERRYWANCLCNQFPKISNICGPDPPTLQTDRRTDGRSCNRNTALCTIVHRMVREW